MKYRFVHMFSMYDCDMSDEEKIHIAKERAIKDLAKKLVEHAHFEVREDGDVVGTLDLRDCD